MSTKIAIFMANGCEEIEGLTVVDILRRAGITIDMVSITGSKTVTGSHKIAFEADKMIEDTDVSTYDGIVLPGGIPGTPNLGACEVVTTAVKEFAAQGKLVAAICAAPSVLGQCGVLDGKYATSYPGFEEEMTGCTYLEDAVVMDDNIITSRGMGTAMEFALAILECLTDQETAVAMGEKTMFYFGDEVDLIS